MISYPCFSCHKPLGDVYSFSTYRYFFRGASVDGKTKLFCDENCYKKYLKKYFVEVYNGQNIYWVLIDNKKCYIPYVGCSYYFKTLENCKRRIDRRDISFVI